MRNGDGFAKKFGGASGNDPDFLKLIIMGFDANQSPTGTVDFYLADFRSANNAEDYIVQDWRVVDLSGFDALTSQLRFGFESSDVNQFGIKTPTYVAVDRVVTVPEPAGPVLFTFAGAALALRRRRS